MKILARLLGSLLNWASSLGIYVSAIAMASMAVLITVEVILRYIFNTSTLVADEMSEYMMVALLYLALSNTWLTGKHITITAVVDRLSFGAKRLCGHIVAVLLPATGIVLSWQAWVLTLESYWGHSISPTILRFPLYIPQTTIALGLTIFTLQVTFGAIGQFRAKSPYKLTGEKSPSKEGT